MQKAHVVTLLVFIYMLFSILFLKAQFQNSQMPKDISNRFLHNSSSSFSHPQSNSSFQLSRKVLFLLIDSAKYSYWKQIKALNDLLDKNPRNCIVAKTIVQQPTMTTQKIQTLMTGSEIFSITSIIDAFFSSSVSVDNIIHQLNNHNGSTVNIGDDTWNKLFKFSKSYPCSTTFDIWDWDTCDLIIYKNLEQEIKSENNLIVAHFLSLDHIGHSSSSITHPEFKQKKDQISRFINKIVDILPQDMILMITGDHGMRDDGNHGGASREQTESFLFVYSKSDQLVPLSKSNQKIQVKQSQGRDIQQLVKQPDITSTLSVLLGVPLPTNSIGIPIFIPARVNDTPEKLNSQISEICQNLMQHFVVLLKKNHVKCSEIMQDTVATPLSLKQVQRNCLSHLSHKQTNMVLLGLIIFVIGFTCLILSIVIRIQVIQYIIVLIISIPHSFSWFLIKNSTTYYIFSLFIVILLMPFKRVQKGILLIGIVAIAQIQQIKNGEYSLNFFRIPLLANILSSWEIQVIIAISWVGVCLKRSISLFLKTRADNGVAFQLVIQILIAISLVLRSLQKEIELQTQINFIVVVITFILFVLYLLPLRCLDIMDSCIKQIILYLIMLFLGTKAISLYLIVNTIFSVLPTLKQGREGIKEKDRLPGIQSFYYYFCYLLSHIIWWVQGNRYEYSSIDIRQSYIFNTNYHEIVNPICLVIYMIMPYLFTLSLGIIGDNSNYKEITQLKETNPSDERRNLKYLNGVEQRQDQQQSIIKNEANKILKSNNTKEEEQRKQDHKAKYILIPFSWAVCCCINVIYNNQKILYTVVYIPMLVIQVAKLIILGTILIVIIQIEKLMKGRKKRNLK